MKLRAKTSPTPRPSALVRAPAEPRAWAREASWTPDTSIPDRSVWCWWRGHEKCLGVGEALQGILGMDFQTRDSGSPGTGAL